jgi:hypothetical protein
MKIRTLSSAVFTLAAVALAVGASSLAQERIPERFGGLINDYTPSTVAGGPYELRGKWSMRLHRESLTADFSAFLNMEPSGYAADGASASPTPTNPVGAHTHHITMTGATVTYLTSDPTGICPGFNPATTGPVLVMTETPQDSTVKITANGGPAPFDKNGPSGLQVCITGGADVAFSNVTLVFSGAAMGHFGSLPIHGVVRNTGWDHDGDDHAR